MVWTGSNGSSTIILIINKVANEFDLLDPASISVHYSEGSSNEYLNTDSFLRGSKSRGGGMRRLVVDPNTHPLVRKDNLHY